MDDSEGGAEAGQDNAALGSGCEGAFDPLAFSCSWDFHRTDIRLCLLVKITVKVMTSAQLSRLFLNLTMK